MADDDSYTIPVSRRQKHPYTARIGPALQFQLDTVFSSTLDDQARCRKHLRLPHTLGTRFTCVIQISAIPAEAQKEDENSRRCYSIIPRGKNEESVMGNGNAFSFGLIKSCMDIDFSLISWRESPYASSALTRLSPPEPNMRRDRKSPYSEISTRRHPSSRTQKILVRQYPNNSYSWRNNYAKAKSP